jgi:RNA polymerase sigma-70 factor (ECF subfamily)
VLRRAQRGDDDAFAVIVRQYQTPLHNYLVRVLAGDRALAEDVCQEVFIRVHRALPSFDGRCLFTTWLFQVAKHRVVDELRARERRGRRSLELDADLYLELTAPPQPGPIEDMEIVWRAIGALSVDLKMALLLRDVVGLPYAEIADALETSLANIKWRIYKAREIVAAQLCREGLDLPTRARSAGRGQV